MTVATGPTARRRHQAPAATVPERHAVGRAARATSPRTTHGAWEPAADRPSPLTVLAEQAASRVPELIPIRNGRMVASPFTFYRGAAAIMAGDLAATPRTGLDVQLCGDAHLLNFGAFAAADRRLVFSLNDFDETLPGPFEWDLKRLVTSFEVAARQRAIVPLKRHPIVLAVAETYRTAMAGFAGMGLLDVWYTRLDVNEIMRRYATDAHAAEVRAFRRAAQRAESKDNLKAMTKLTHLVDGQPQFINDPPIVERLELLADAEEAARMERNARAMVRSYMSSLTDDRRTLIERYRFADIARKVVGVGSVGTRSWVVLMIGRDDGDPLLLQFKEAQPSVLEPYLGASIYQHHGRRVVEGQRLLQASSDILLGWQTSEGIDRRKRDFFVRQLWDKKGAIDVEAMTPRGLLIYAKLCGWTLARARTRSGDPVAISAYLGRSDTFDRAMLAFAQSYADQNERDHATLEQAIDAGEIEAIHGV